MIFVGIDPSLLATGVCRLADGDLKTQTVRPLKTDRDAKRLAYIQDRVLDLCVDADLIAIEGYAYGAKFGRVFEIGELGGVLKLGLYERGISYVNVPPTVVKKFLTGKGKADKIEMMNTGNEILSMRFSDSHQCDAWVLACIAAALKNQSQSISLTPARQKVLREGAWGGQS